ncbi:MAG TPA: ThiF family adenylyltransferase [Candidatus Norongarragalinales archaeon]|jgi:adenylyltransferase/sulfurtransferase|nr:ThiF family adenylyltransferase [Candidatus Norongarragalinales archaeon]
MEINRFLCQTLLVGIEAQKKIEYTRIAIVGIGGIGSHAALHAIQSGLGNILLIDHDKLEDSNISRCAFFEESDIGKKKSLAVLDHLQNVGAVVQASQEKLTPSNAEKLLGKTQVVLDCTDNYESRKTIADFCAKAKIPWIYSGAARAEAMVTTFMPGGKTRFSDLAAKPEYELPCNQVGVLPAAVSLAATVQNAEMLNVIQGKPALEGKLFYGDLRAGQFIVQDVKKRK